MPTAARCPGPPCARAGGRPGGSHRRRRRARGAPPSARARCASSRGRSRTARPAAPALAPGAPADRGRGAPTARATGRSAGASPPHVDVTSLDRRDRGLYDQHMALTMARTTMVPPADLLPDVLPTARLNARAMPVRPLRDELRRIPTARNALTVVMALVETFGVAIAAAVIDTWWAYLLAFLLMGRGHALLNILGHEAAHRLLFPNRRANDLVGRWLLSYPTLLAFGAYRRVHFAHHRDELGPEEPDLALYRGYPIPADSWHRKLRRDLLGVSGWKNL